jgi:hypothetical protein
MKLSKDVPKSNISTISHLKTPKRLGRQQWKQTRDTVMAWPALSKVYLSA